MITIIYSQEQKVIGAIQSLIEIDPRPSSEKLVLELHEWVNIQNADMGNFVDRCMRKNLYNPFLNRPDHTPAEVSLAYKANGEWYVAYYPCLNYYLSEEEQNLLEMREFCHQKGIRVLAVDGAKAWLADHGFKDPMDRNLIARIRMAKYDDAITEIRKSPLEVTGTAIYCGGIVMDRILRDINREVRDGYVDMRKTSMGIARNLIQEDLISRDFLRDIEWAFHWANQSLYGLPKGFDESFFFDILEDLLSLLRDLRR